MEFYKYTEPIDSNELYHWGIKGMKWGVRRYQNKDGTYTPAGEKRRRSLGQVIHDHKVNKKRKAALEKARAAKVEKKEAEAKAAAEAAERRKKLEAGKIPVKKMTDEELKWSLERQRNEAQYKENELKNLTGKRFVNKIINEAFIPAATGAAKDLSQDLLKKYGKEVLGLKEKESTYDKLKKQDEMERWKVNIQKNKDWLTDRESIREVEASKRENEYWKNKANAREKKHDYETGTTRDKKKVSEIEPGDKVVEKDGHKYRVYEDDNGDEYLILDDD